MNKTLNKLLYRKDLDTFMYWPLSTNFDETEEYKNGFLKLDTGENIFDFPKQIWDKLKTLQLKYYPGISDELISLLAKKDKITKENIYLGGGSLNLVDAIIRLFIDPGDEVITCSPTYVMYEYFVQLARGKTIDVPRKDTEIDIKAIKNSLTSKTKMIILDNPTNPFGYTISQEQIRSLLNLQII
ncbi:MAG TPA: aminotransferase class I/II-fold pyridoxal phosphate-dependent enzyme, partial [Patescibacteria group bacterium]|nr:aminotransferase class I/II-fold pyridoxal phosphate-dependent enzyme [Patescibacteria group bacterium]